MEDRRDDAEAAEDLVPVANPPAPDVPEADALEQAAEVQPTDPDVPEEIGDAPEADALDQQRPVEDPEEDRR